MLLRPHCIKMTIFSLFSAAGKRVDFDFSLVDTEEICRLINGCENM